MGDVQPCIYERKVSLLGGGDLRQMQTDRTREGTDRRDPRYCDERRKRKQKGPENGEQIERTTDTEIGTENGKQRQRDKQIG